MLHYYHGRDIHGLGHFIAATATATAYKLQSGVGRQGSLSRQRRQSSTRRIHIIHSSSNGPGVRREKLAREAERLRGCRHCHGSELGRVRTAGRPACEACGRASEEIDEATCLETYKELCKSSQHSTLMRGESLRNRNRSRKDSLVAARARE